MTIRVLHVEDDADIQEIAKMALEFSGDFEVNQCASGEEALQRAADLDADVLLFDLMMPGMSGDILLDRFREIPRFNETPAIFMTARGQAEAVKSLKERGALDVIVKPFDPVTLGDQVRSILASRNVLP